MLRVEIVELICTDFKALDFFEQGRVLVNRVFALQQLLTDPKSRFTVLELTLVHRLDQFLNELLKFRKTTKFF